MNSFQGVCSVFKVTTYVSRAQVLAATLDTPETTRFKAANSMTGHIALR